MTLKISQMSFFDSNEKFETKDDENRVGGKKTQFETQRILR